MAIPTRVNAADVVQAAVDIRARLTNRCWLSTHTDGAIECCPLAAIVIQHNQRLREDGTDAIQDAVYASWHEDYVVAFCRAVDDRPAPEQFELTPEGRHGYNDGLAVAAELTRKNIGLGFTRS